MGEILQIISTILFFVVYFKYDIYLASLCLSIFSIIQLILSNFIPSSKNTMSQTSLGMIALFGFSTWYFNNPLFIQWKITIANCAFAIFLYAYRHFHGEAFFTSTFKASKMPIPNHAGENADNMMAVFFLLIGVLNYFIFTNYSESTWVLFKTSIIFINIIYLVLITAYLSRFVTQVPENEGS